MTFESVSNLVAQQEYSMAIQELAKNPNGLTRNKAIEALMKLYPQWQQHEWEHCVQEDIKEAMED